MPLSRYRLADNQESRGNSHRARCFLKSPRGEAMHRTRTAPSEKQPAAVATKFLRLFHAVPLGHRIDGWRVCWVGGWDRSQVLFVVMVEAPATPFPRWAPKPVGCRRSVSRRRFLE